MKFELSDSWPQRDRDDALSPTSLVVEDGPSLRRRRELYTRIVVANCVAFQFRASWQSAMEYSCLAEPQTVRCTMRRRGRRKHCRRSCQDLAPRSHSAKKYKSCAMTYSAIVGGISLPLKPAQMASCSAFGIVATKIRVLRWPAYSSANPTLTPAGDHLQRLSFFQSYQVEKF
jgi:hypothetical protein